jgi:hypothetical protein
VGGWMGGWMDGWMAELSQERTLIHIPSSPKHSSPSKKSQVPPPNTVSNSIYHSPCLCNLYGQRFHFLTPLILLIERTTIFFCKGSKLETQDWSPCLIWPPPATCKALRAGIETFQISSTFPFLLLPPNLCAH